MLKYNRVVKLVSKIARRAVNVVAVLDAAYIVEATYISCYRTGKIKTVRHYARNWDAAIAWMCCYHVDDDVRVYVSCLGMKLSGIIAARLTLK